MKNFVIKEIYSNGKRYTISRVVLFDNKTLFVTEEIGSECIYTTFFGVSKNLRGAIRMVDNPKGAKEYDYSDNIVNTRRHRANEYKRSMMSQEELEYLPF